MNGQLHMNQVTEAIRQRQIVQKHFVPLFGDP